MLVPLHIKAKTGIHQLNVNSAKIGNTFLWQDKATNDAGYNMHSKVHIKNYGCSSNTADGETLAGCLKQAGYTLTTTEAEADLVIYNSCAVKGPTENRIIDDIKHAPKNKKIIVAGCLPKISFERLKPRSPFRRRSRPSSRQRNRRRSQPRFSRRKNHRFSNTQRKTITYPT